MLLRRNSDFKFFFATFAASHEKKQRDNENHITLDLNDLPDSGPNLIFREGRNSSGDGTWMSARR